MKQLIVSMDINATATMDTTLDTVMEGVKKHNQDAYTDVVFYRRIIR